MTSAENNIDVVEFLTDQHRQIRTMFDEVMQSTGHARREAFDRLRRLLAVHETAEEQIVHPRARRILDDGQQVIDDRLQEEHDAKQVLAELEQLDVNSEEFSAKLETFREDVLAHAAAEEREEFGYLSDALTSEELGSLGRAAEVAERLAPTHPHAGVESVTAHLLTGPFAAMLDRSRDLISGINHDV